MPWEISAGIPGECGRRRSHWAVGAGGRGAGRFTLLAMTHAESAPGGEGSGAPISGFVFDWVDEHGRSRPEAPAIGTPLGWITYGQLRERVFSLAALLSERGVA